MLEKERRPAGSRFGVLDRAGRFYRISTGPVDVPVEARACPTGLAGGARLGLVLVIRGTKKLRDRMKGAPTADGADSTTALGDWFANALFWRPQVALLVNSRTLLPVLMELAPAATLLERAPATIEAVLRRHGVDETFLAAERTAMSEVRIGPTNDRRVVGVVNEFAFHGEWLFKEGQDDLEALSLRMSSLIIGKLDEGSPDRALAAVMGDAEPLAKVIAFPGERTAPAPSPRAPAARRRVPAQGHAARHQAADLAPRAR